MLNIPEEIKELFRADNISDDTKKNLKLYFFDEEINLLFPEDTLYPSEDLFPANQEPVLVITNSQIYTESLAITEELCSGDSLTFGECNSSQFEITVADVTMDLTGKEFMATVEIGGYEMALGIYTVYSFVRQADRRLKKITAYDRMQNFDVDVATWYQGLAFPMTLKAFRDSLCSYVGITQLITTLPLDDMQVTETIEPSQLAGRDVLSAICEINGCFGNIDKTGRLSYKFLGSSSLFPSEELFPDEDLYPSQIEGETLSYYKKSDTTYEDYLVYGIDGVQIRQEDGDVGASYGEGTNAYIIQGNFLVYGKVSEDLLSIAAAVYENFSQKIYRPCTIVTAALPWVEPGDGIICYTTDDIIETYCLKRTLKGIQAMMDTYVAQGTQEQEQSFGLANEIIQLEGKTAVIKKSVEEVSVRVTDLKEYTEAQFKVTADQIIAEVTRATQAEASLSIKADEIALSVTNLAEETNSRFEQTSEQITLEVNNLRSETNSKFTQTAEQIALKVSKGDVSAQLSVESDKVTISGNRLIVNSTNFILDENGNATFSGDINGANIYGSYFEGGAIDIGGGTFYVDSNGNAAINAGEINLGGVSIKENYSDLGAFRISSQQYGVLFSTNGEITLATSGAIEDNPMLKISKNGKTTYVGYGGISTGQIDCNEIYLSGSFWDGWSLTEEIKLLHNRVFGTDY